MKILRLKHYAFLVISLMTIVAAGSVYGIHEGVKVTPSPIQLLVDKIRAKPTRVEDIDYLKLAHLICLTPSANIRDQDIDSLIAWVQDGSYGEVYWSAGDLGLIGPRAQKAIPVLEEVQKKATKYETSAHAGMDSEPLSAVIQRVLSDIKGETPHVGCKEAVNSSVKH